MLQSKMLGKTQKEWPSEATLKSHGLLLKGGYIKQVTSGIFSLLPLARKVSLKIENIIREEMNAIDAQEVLMPLVSTKELWSLSERYENVGKELIKFKDRTDTDLVLSMTHEEIAVHNAMSDAVSYQKYPFSIYHIQTKFRDEARSRGGLIRVREFTMKDAYSFHTSEESLDKIYEDYYKAYERIYKRVGLDKVVAVKSDNGMMGGSGSHEFMLLCDAGEDKIVICDECGYKSNMEIAEVTGIEPATTKVEELKKIHTPGVKTIDGLHEFSNVPVEHMAKAVIYSRLDNNKTVIVFVRADREVNEAKLRNHLGYDITPKVASSEDDIAYGSVGPVGLDLSVVEVVYDKSLENEVWLLAGANEVDYHLSGINIKRDVGEVEYVDIAKIIDKDICPICKKKALKVSNGIEVGNIFKLGKKYTETMKMSYLDENGKEEYPYMGCYGIGVERLLASVLEETATENATNWPASIAPFDVHICPIGYPNKEVVKEITDKLYNDLIKEGFDVLLDDRNKNAGVKFADADLVGAPIRLVIGIKNLENNEIETKIREETKLIKVDEIIDFVKNKNKELLEKYK